MNLPRISIVTPSYNQAPYLGTTLRSVLDQGYPDLEYIVMDGGSTDGSADVLQAYADRLSHWESGPDGGHYAAVNAGFSHATGDVFAWLNSDDMYFPWTLAVVGEVFARYPALRWLSGDICYMNRRGQVVETEPTAGGLNRGLAARGAYARGLAATLPQEGMFWRRDLWEEAGGLDTRYRLAADYELWCRFARFAEPVRLQCLVAAFRRHPEAQRSATMAAQYEAEAARARASLPALPRGFSLAGRTRATNLLYRLAFLRGPSASIAYDPAADAWRLHRQSRGRLYRPLVIRRKV